MSEIKLKSYPEEHEETSLTNASMVYTQHDDLKSNDFQDLNIELGDNGGGHYLVLKTERWAINDVDELIKVLEDFKKRVGFE